MLDVSIKFRFIGLYSIRVFSKTTNNFSHRNRLIMITNVKYIFLTALRDWLFWAMLAGVLGASIIAHLLGSTAAEHVQEMTITYSSNAARVMIIMGLIIFACFHVRSTFDTHEIDVFLSRPITRQNLVISYWLGFANVAFLHALATVLLLAAQGVIHWGGFIIWSISLLLECWLAVAIALFAAFTLRSAVGSVLISMGIYVISRMIAYFIATSQSGLLFDKAWINYALIESIKGTSVVVPRLDFFTKSEWLIEGVKHSSDIKLFVIQAAIFIPLLIFAAIADFRRKQF